MIKGKSNPAHFYEVGAGSSTKDHKNGDKIIATTAKLKRKLENISHVCKTNRCVKQTIAIN